MANNVTMLEKLINPEVMADMISYELENKLAATQFYKIDRTLVGRAGDKITVPAWKYIGMAEDVAENAQVPRREMDTVDVSYSVKKAAVEVALTDEAVLSGYGDPVGETTRQLRLSIQEKMEDDGIMLLKGIDSTTGLVYETKAPISYDVIVEAANLFKLEEQGTELYLLANQNLIKTLRKDDKFYDRMTAAGDRVFTTGVVGSVAGCSVVISNRLADDEAYIMTPKCLTAFMKRDLTVETEREMSFKRTKIGSDCHYVIAIEDYDKLVAIRLTA